MLRITQTTILCLLIAITPILAGNSISGKISSSSTGKPLPFAQIIIPELDQGTISDIQGNFQFSDLAVGNYQISVSYVGYESLTQNIGVLAEDTSPLSISLTEKPINLEEILVEAPAITAVNAQVYSENLGLNAPRDVGDFFKTIAGGSAVKKGGYAQDPSIRGFQKEQLNIQFDQGIKVWGGCPNRMDPPTSHIQAGDLEKIEVIRGPFSVRWGQSMGGIVNLVMRKPHYSQDFRISGSVNGGYESNGENKRGRISLLGGNENWDFYLGGGSKSFGDYSTGIDSVVVPSNYEINDLSAKLAYNFSYDTRLQVSLRQARVENVDFPGIPMDARSDASDIYSLSYSRRNITPIINSLNAKVYISEVGHIMDNQDRANSAMVEAVTDADTKTMGGRIELGLNPIPGQKLFAGIDYYRHGKTGYRERFVKTNPCNMSMHPNMTFIDSVWQDASISDLGTFAELRHFLNPRLSYTVGVRVDAITAHIGEPAGNFIQAYGKADTWTETNISGMGILRYSPGHTLDMTLSLGRGIRSADIGERFINHLPIGASPHEHVGNPELKPEINHQVEIGLVQRLGKHRLSSNAFYSNISNYIFAQVDSSVGRVFLACQEPKVSKVFQNLDKARQYGYELGIAGDITDALGYDITLAYTEGENLDDSAPLPEMPPFETRLILDYRFSQMPVWIQLEGRWVGDQDRVSVAYGENSTPGFSLYNLRSGVQVLEGLEVGLSVSNLLDTAYYEHLSRNFAKNTPDAGIPLYEPGRNVIMNAVYQF